MGFAAHAQDSRPVTYDDINTVARRMFCPECENIPLDKCATVVCIQWKREIGEQLAAGMTSDQIVAGFVARFGDQVVGVPQDPFLRNLALIAPTLFILLAVAIGGYTIWSRLQGNLTANVRTDYSLSSRHAGDNIENPFGMTLKPPTQPTGATADYPDKDSDTSEHPVGATHESSSFAAKSASATKSDEKYRAQLEQDVDRE